MTELGISERSAASDLLGAPARLRERGCLLGHPLRILSTTTSTSDEAQRAAREGAPHGATWVAEEQTAGRGRRGHIWVLPAGEGLLFSVLLRLRCDPARLPPIALLAGLAVQEAVARAAPRADVRIKWPNDVVVGGRKLAGVLVEASTLASRVDAVVVGIGINVRTRTFLGELANKATSVALASGVDEPDRGWLLAEILHAFDRDLRLAAGRGLELVAQRLASVDALQGQRVRSESQVEGVACGVDADGRLLVRADDGLLMRWAAGEVHLAKV